jgi:hypothetical protein
MPGPRTRAVAAAAGLSALLGLGIGLGAAAPALAGNPGGTTTASAAAASDVSMAFTSTKTPAALLAASVTAMRAASSVHVKLHTKGASSIIDLDFVVAKAGGRGTIGDGVAGVAHLLRVKSKVWMSGDLRFWTTSGAKNPAALVGKWVAVTGTDAKSTALRNYTTVSFWAGSIAGLKATKRVAGRVVRHLPTVGLLAGDTTVYVAATGRPHPLLLVNNTLPSDTVALYDWNKRVTFTPPAAKLIVKP